MVIKKYDPLDTLDTLESLDTLDTLGCLTISRDSRDSWIYRVSDESLGDQHGGDTMTKPTPTRAAQVAARYQERLAQEAAQQLPTMIDINALSTFKETLKRRALRIAWADWPIGDPNPTLYLERYGDDD